MIVDVHTHTPTHRDKVPAASRATNAAFRPDRLVTTTVSWSDFDDAQLEGHVDVALVFNIAVRDPAVSTGLPTDPRRINDATAEFAADDPARRIGFMSVHPDEPGAMNELDRCTGDLGLRGIKLGPNYQGFDPLGSPARRIYAEAERRGLPILFHQGTSPIRDAPLRYAHPLVMDEIAIAHPELRIVMAHLGHPWQADTIAVVRKHPNVFADVSAGFYRPWSFYTAMRLATEWNVLEKLLFGSDYPVATPAETAAGLRGLNAVPRASGLPPIPEDRIEAIIQRDSLALLGLERPS